jgi:hypothetical protein
MLTAIACDDAGDDLNLHPVPVTPGNEQLARQTGPQPGESSAPAGLPPDHPPIPGDPNAAAPAAAGADLPADHPPIPATGEAGQPRPTGAASGGTADAVWSVPLGWVPTAPASSMRVEQWALPGSTADAPAECAMLSFPGGGSVQDNIDRWLGQLEQPDGSNTRDHAVVDQHDVNGLEVTTMAATGTFLSRDPPMSGPVVRRPGYLMFAAIFPGRDAPYFLKCTGPEPVMRNAEASLEGMVHSFRLR